MDSPPCLSVGTVHRFDYVVGNGSYAVFQKAYQDGSGRVTYVVARVPSLRAYTETPGSVLEEFPDRSSAVEKFTCWMEDPLGTQPLPRGKKHPRQDFGQNEFSLGPLQTKEEALMEALRRQMKSDVPGAHQP